MSEGFFLKVRRDLGLREAYALVVAGHFPSGVRLALRSIVARLLGRKA